jgi:hypothetical protein
LGLHWLYGGIAGFIGGMTGAMVKAAINRQPVVYTAENIVDDFRWGARFSFAGAAIGHFTEYALTMQFRREAAGIAEAMSQGGGPSHSIELVRISRLAQSGVPQNMNKALLLPATADQRINITVYQFGKIIDIILNDNYWKDFWNFIAN